MELFFAGDGFPTSCAYIYNQGYSRLLSYVNNKTRAVNYILNKRWDNMVREFDLYLAGDSSGFPELVPEKLIQEYNTLLSYVHPKGIEGIEKIGKVKRSTSMELFLVGPEKDVIMQDVINVSKTSLLFNYIDGKKATDRYKEQIKPKKLFIDSGAFSAWTKGKQVDVDEYIQFINDRSDYIDLCGQIDAIPGDIINGATTEQVNEAAEKTWKNYLYMRPKMNKPESLLYTFHVDEPSRYLIDALNYRDPNGNYIPYIALGGMVGKTTKVKQNFLRNCFDIIAASKNPNVKVHAFGMTSFSLLKDFPITSADSTSWIMTGANGNIMTDSGIVAVSEKMSRLPEHYSKFSPKYQLEFENTIKSYGFTLQELKDSRDCRIMFNARYMVKKAKELVYVPEVRNYTLY